MNKRAGNRLHIRATRVVLSLALAIAMVLGMIPGTGSVLQVRAEQEVSGKTITGLSTGTIGNPKNGKGGWNKVYFGSKDEIIRFNVLKVGESVFTSGENRTLLLDCADVLELHKFDEDGQPNEGATRVDWAHSDIRVWLNGDFKNARFTDSEIAAIATSSKSSKANNYDGDGWEPWGTAGISWAPVQDDQIFFLDGVEATNRTYGFPDNEQSDIRMKYLNGNYAPWWLRSQAKYSNTSVGGSRDGNVQSVGCNDEGVGVSPTLNVKLSSIMFSSLIPSETNSYKLTVLDKDSQGNNLMSVSSTGAVMNNSTVTVPYTITGDNASNATQVSVVVTGSDVTWSETTGWSTTDEPIQYTKLNVDSWSTEGSGTFTLNTNMVTGTWGTNYKVYLVAEDVNEGKATDYASAPVEIHLHNLTYAAGTGDNANVITVSCANSGCPLTESPVSLELVAPKANTYGETEDTSAALIGKDAFNTATGLNVSDDSIKYYKAVKEDETYTKDGEALDAAPTDAGDYIAEFTLSGVKTAQGDNKSITVSVGYTFDKADGSIKKAPVAKNPTYNGKSQELVTAGETNNGTMLYALGNKTKATEAYSESIPTATEVGTYYVWYKVVGDDNHNDIDETSLAATIKQIPSDGTITTSGIYCASNYPTIQAGINIQKSNENDVVEYRWVGCNNSEPDKWFEVSPWTKDNNWMNWTPEKSGGYVFVCYARVVGNEETSEIQYAFGTEYHKQIKGICQMPYTGEGGGYLIGIESYDNPNNSYSYEMLILDCNLYMQGKDAWVYTTGRCGAQGNCLWTVWQPTYGYYWTLFRVYDANGELIDEACYGFQNVN